MPRLRNLNYLKTSVPKTDTKYARQICGKFNGYDNIFETGYSTWRDTAKSVFGQFKGHNSGVPGGIWQVIELGRDIMPTNIITKFDIDLMKTL